MAERRPRFEKNRGKPYKDPGLGVMRQSEYVGGFQSIYSGFRSLAQLDGWSRSYQDGSQRVSIDRIHTDKIFS